MISHTELTTRYARTVVQRANGVGDGVELALGLGVGLTLGLGEGVGVADGSGKGVSLGVGSGVAVGVGVGVGVGDGVGLGTETSKIMMHCAAGIPSTACCLVGAVGATGCCRPTRLTVSKITAPKKKLIPATNTSPQLRFNDSI